jgi:hypothetical protein
VKILAAAAMLCLAACAGGPPPPDWQLGASSALRAFEEHYLKGDSQLAEIEFARAKDELRSTGRGDLLARAELVRCAARTASLEFDDCPGFEALRAEAGAEERAYADFLAGRAAHAAGGDALSQLVGAGVALKTAAMTPAQIEAAVQTSSAQGWRRPLLAWLGVQAKRAEDAGEREAAAAIRRRIEVILGSR